MKIDLISTEKLNELLAVSPKPRVTKEYIDGRIESIEGVEFSKISDTMTLCQILLDNGYQVIGTSACVHPENYNQEIGEKLAYEDAFKKLWPLFGFLLAEWTLLEEKSDTGDVTEPNRAENAKKAADGVAINVSKLIEGAIEKVHKDSGVPSDVTAACHSAIRDAVQAEIVKGQEKAA